MKLVVLCPGATQEFPDTVDYETADGELDIADADGVVICTFAKGGWYSISRHKEDDEEWPHEIGGPNPEMDGGDLDEDQEDYGYPAPSGLTLVGTEKSPASSEDETGD